MEKQTQTFFQDIYQTALYLCEEESEKRCIEEEKSLIIEQHLEAYIVFCNNLIKAIAENPTLKLLKFTDYDNKSIMDCYIMRRIFVGKDLYRATNHCRKKKFRENNFRVSFSILKENLSDSVLKALNTIIKNTAEECDLFVERPMENNLQVFSGCDFEFDIIDAILVSDKVITEEDRIAADFHKEHLGTQKIALNHKVIEIFVIADGIY